MGKSEEMKPKSGVSQVELLAEDLERKLIREWGAILCGEGLARNLGYRSLGTLRQAIKHRALPVPLFSIKGRRGKFAFAKDVARWIAEQRASVGLPDADPTPHEGGD